MLLEVWLCWPHTSQSHRAGPTLAGWPLAASLTLRLNLLSLRSSAPSPPTEAASLCPPWLPASEAPPPTELSSPLAPDIVHLQDTNRRLTASQDGHSRPLQAAAAWGYSRTTLDTIDLGTDYVLLAAWPACAATVCNFITLGSHHPVEKACDLTQGAKITAMQQANALMSSLPCCGFPGSKAATRNGETTTAVISTVRPLSPADEVEASTSFGPVPCRPRYRWH